jgi:hypothetical protein
MYRSIDVSGTHLTATVAASSAVALLSDEENRHTDEGLGKSGELEEVARVAEDDRGTDPQLVGKGRDGDDGSAPDISSSLTRGKTSTHEIGTSEAIKQGHVLLLVGQDLTILNLLQDDPVLVLDIVVVNAPVDPPHRLARLVVLALDSVEPRAFGDEEEDDEGEAEEDPHRVDRVTPLARRHLRHDL